MHTRKQQFEKQFSTRISAPSKIKVCERMFYSKRILPRSKAIEIIAVRATFTQEHSPALPSEKQIDFRD